VFQQYDDDDSDDDVLDSCCESFCARETDHVTSDHVTTHLLPALISC